MENKKTKEQWEFDENEVVDETKSTNQTKFSADSWFVESDKDTDSTEIIENVDENEKTSEDSKTKNDADDTKNAKAKNNNKKKVVFIVLAIVSAVILAVVGIAVGVLIERNDTSNKNIVWGNEIVNLTVEDAKWKLQDYEVDIEYMYSSTVPTGYVIGAGDVGWYWDEFHGENITYENTDIVSVIVSAGNYGSQYLYSNEEPGEDFIYTEGNFFKTWYQDEKDNIIGEGLDWCDWDTFYGTHYEELAPFDSYYILDGAYEIENDYFLCVEKCDGWYRTWYQDGEENYVADGLDQGDWDEFYYTHYEELADYDAFDIPISAYEVSENYFLCIDKAKYQYQPAYEIYD